MKEKPLNRTQQERINKIMEEWEAEVKKIPEASPKEYAGGFNDRKAREHMKPYEELRDRYLPMIEAIKSEQ